MGKYPDPAALPELVWTRPQVRDLVRKWFGIGLSLVTIGKYLRSWGLSPQKPIRRAYEQNPQAVARWLEVEYPAIAARAKKEKAIVLWLDQTGLRSDAAVGTTWAPVGKTPVVGKTGKRSGVNVMAAVSNKGELYFTCYRGSFTGPVFLAYLQRLRRGRCTAAGEAPSARRAGPGRRAHPWRWASRRCGWTRRAVLCMARLTALAWQARS